MISDFGIFSTYVVQPGDSLWEISRRYQTTVDQLKVINNLTTNELYPGQILKLPLTKNNSQNTMNYNVQPGDSLWSIAKRYGMTVDEIKSLNKLNNTYINPGQILKVYSNTIYSDYVVKSGDSLWSIANFFGMSIDELKTLNQLDNEILYPGQRLTIIKRDLPKETTTITYTVVDGDTLWELANKFNITVDRIRKMNNLTTDTLSIGQKLIISKVMTPTDAKILVKVKRYSGLIEMIPLEEYVTGVVSSELSAGFNDEAYKSLALAARTYAVKRIREGKVITDTDSHQVYKDQKQLRDWWRDDYDKIYNNIRLAVSETVGEVIVYDGELIDSLFSSTTNGRTEDPRHVWGGSLPYLKSVDSKWDRKSPYYYDVKNLTYAEFRSRLGLSQSASLQATVISRTDGDSVNKIKISGKEFKGEEVRKKLGLKSTDFDIKFENGKAIIRQRGWGHQVGLSQYGAHFMGLEGYNYKQIIKHYYPGVEIINLYK